MPLLLAPGGDSLAAAAGGAAALPRLPPFLSGSASKEMKCAEPCTQPQGDTAWCMAGSGGICRDELEGMKDAHQARLAGDLRAAAHDSGRGRDVR